MASPTMRLEILQPFALTPSLESGQAHRWSRDGETAPGVDGGWHWGVVGGNLIKVRSLGGGSRVGASEIEFRSSPENEPKHLQSLLSSYFRLDDDLEAIYQEITKDPRVASMVGQYRGLRLLRVEPWECLISFICSANSNMPRIHANMESMSVEFGASVTLDGTTRYVFPEPARLAEAGESALRTLGLGFRAPYVARAARAVAEGELELEALRHTPYLEAKARLVELPGIGPKIADCVLLHSLDKAEAFPIDVWVRRALVEWYFPGGKAPPDRDMLQWAQAYFSPHAGYAQLYLFHGRRLHRG